MRKPIRIAVIMASYLGEYEWCAKDRESKFIRAVNSFLANDYPQKRLVIISHGCSQTFQVLKNNFADELKNELIIVGSVSCLHKQRKTFDGVVRQWGIDMVSRGKHKADMITYLDTDDTIGGNHLSRIIEGYEYFNKIKKIDFVYYDDLINDIKNTPPHYRNVEIKENSIGLSSISHINKKQFNWNGCNDYGHDWLFIRKLLKKGRYVKIMGGSYTVNHIPRLFDN